MSFTDEEKEEYQEYVKKAEGLVIQYMKTVKVPAVDQTNSIAAPQRKRTLPMVPHNPAKKVKADTRTVSETVTKEKEKTSAVDLSYTITNDTEANKKSVARANPRLVSSDLLITESESEREESQSELEVTAEEESEYEPTYKPRTVITSNKTVTPKSVEKIASSVAVQKPEKLPSNSGDVDKSKKKTANDTRVINNDNEHLSSGHKAKLSDLAKSQQQRIYLEIGGTKYSTTANILQRENSILCDMVKKESPLQPMMTRGIYTYYIERTPEMFDLILNYLRMGRQDVMDLLPSEITPLRRLYREAKYYELKGLCSLIMERCLNLVTGEASKKEE